MTLKRYKDFIVESKKDNLWTYEGDFTIDSSMTLNGKFIKGEIPDIINGDFDCSDINLISLEGGPKTVKHHFYCYGNLLTSLEGGPKKIERSFNCENNQLTSLEGISKNIGGNVYSDLRIEQIFINSGSYINNYWNDLLKYMLNQKIDLSEIKTWPKGFLTKETIKSVKGISKFNL